MIQLSPEQEERAQRLHASSFVFDFFPAGEPMILSPSEEAVMHEALGRGIPSGGVMALIKEQRTRDIAADPAASERMRQMWARTGVNAVTCTLGGLDSRFEPMYLLMRDIARWSRRFQVADYITHCLTADDLERTVDTGQLGVWFNLQDTNWIDPGLENLDVLHNFGVRMIQLTYNSRSLVGDGCTERVQSGLSHLGVAAVKRMNELGIVVDVSHCGVQTTFDAIEVSDKPIAFSHTGCRALYDHPRSKTDDQLRALAERDGYVGIYVVPFFLTADPNPGLDVMLDHIEHAASIVGIQRVGIGTDWGSWTADLPQPLQAGIHAEFARRGFREEHGMKMGGSLGELDSYLNCVQITRGLVSRGYSDDEIRGILGRNYLDLVRRAVA
jgi:membrane dipeptidase